jgi:hypothetical protein
MWEFIRQYMEGDDRHIGKLANMVVQVADVAERRETPVEIFRRVVTSHTGWSPIALLFIPLALMFYPGRFIAMYTSKIPQWPKEIEDTCQFAPNDPNIRDGTHLADRDTAPKPDVAAHAGK